MMKLKILRNHFITAKEDSKKTKQLISFQIFSNFSY